MSSGKIIIIILLAIAGLVLAGILFLSAIIGIPFMTDGCFLRYNVSGDSSDGNVINDIIGAIDDMVPETNLASNSTYIIKDVVLKANGNYTISNSSSESEATIDPSSYGKWLNTNMRVTEGQVVNIKLQGEVSLCKAYLPVNNLQTDSNQDIDGQLIEIPRVEDATSPPVNLIFSADANEWRNIAEVYKGDHVQVTLKPDQITVAEISNMYDSINKTMITADCREGNIEYNPICGRYYSWNTKLKYLDQCQFVAQCYECNPHSECIEEEVAGVCNAGYQTVYDWCSCYENQYGVAPEPYFNDGRYTYNWSDDLNDLRVILDGDCRVNQAYIDGDYQKTKRFWYSANNGAGLLYRFSVSDSPSETIGSDYNISALSPTSGTDNIALDMVYDADQQKSYLQYRLYGYEPGQNVTVSSSGGYVLGIKQTKCRRKNGQVISDEHFNNRGAMEYVVANTDPGSSGGSEVTINSSGEGQITGGVGTLWLRLKNKSDDYQNSSGQYNVQLTTEVVNGNFSNDVLTPFLNEFRGMINSTAINMFQNITCFNDVNRQENCQSYFDYLRAILILYVMSYGFLSLMGMLKTKQIDVVIRIVKVGLVAGLMNDRTFVFFATYVFPLITNATDELIANIPAYSFATTDNSVSNPLEFLTDVLSQVLFNPTFSAQMMALLSVGLHGIIYFILMVVAVGMLLIVLFRSITIYIIAFMALAVLTGMAPLFLTFLLFERTKQIFEKWIQYCFQYILEPVILLAGVIILTQLITIFLDYVLGYSVCWKCALPIKIPFINIAGVTPAFIGVPLFCINWFVPWGVDPSTSTIGINLQYIIILLILTYSMWNYADFANLLTVRITGAFGISTANSMGSEASGAFENQALKAIDMDEKSRSEGTDSFSQIKRHVSDNIKSHATAIDEGYGKGKSAIKSGLKSGANKISDKAKSMFSSSKSAKAPEDKSAEKPTVGGNNDNNDS